MSECPNCKGTLWVCENHPDKAWEDECACGAGMPCACNPEAIHPGSIVLVDRSGVDIEALLETVGTQDKRIADLKAKLEEAENPRCICELGQQADMACYHHGIGSPDHLAALESTLHGMERQYTKAQAQAAALAEALERLANAKGCADPDCCDAAREQESARGHALSVLQAYREGR